MEKIKMDIILERIQNRRKDLGYSYQNLADKTGISKSTLQRYETGAIKNIPLDKLEILANALHTNPAYLMGWEDNPIDYGEIDDVYVPTEYAKLGTGVKEYLEFKEAENPDIRMIARAGKKMTPEQAENLRKYAEFMFPEAFEE